MMDDLRSMPHSLQAEQAVLGALLIDNDSFDRCGVLRPSDFFVGEHRTIFAAIQRHIEAGKPVDPLTLADELPCIGMAALHALAAGTPSSANIGRYAEIVRDRARRRDLIAVAAEIHAQAADESVNARDLIDRAQTQLDDAASTGNASEPVAVADDLLSYVEELERRRSGVSTAIPTGFPDLDAKLSGGIGRGQVVLIAARPKVGKTALALAIARNVAEQRSVLLLEMEMPRTQIHDRNVAAIGRIPLGRLLDPNRMTDVDWDGISAAIGRLGESHLHIDDQAGLRMVDVRSKARTVKRKHGLDLLVIDYLQLMEADGDNRNSQIESITRGLKVLAKELSIGVLLLSQLNREVEKRSDKRPMPSDLRDSGSIEQDCDAAIFLYRDEVYNPDSPDKGIVEANVALNRQGATGVVGLAYIGEQTRFDSLELGTRFGVREQPRRARNSLMD